MLVIWAVAGQNGGSLLISEADARPPGGRAGDFVHASE